jgi:hypothetical protein
MQEAVEEFASGDFFLLYRSPLDHDAIREKMLFNQHKELALIHGRWLEHLRVRGSHGAGERSPRQEIEGLCMKGKKQEEEDGIDRESGLGF